MNRASKRSSSDPSEMTYTRADVRCTPVYVTCTARNVTCILANVNCIRVYVTYPARKISYILPDVTRARVQVIQITGEMTCTPVHIACTAIQLT